MLKLDRYLLGDFVQSFLATLIVLLVVSVGGVLVDILGNIADGRLPAKLLFSQLGLQFIAYLPLILPLASYAPGHGVWLGPDDEVELLQPWLATLPVASGAPTAITSPSSATASPPASRWACLRAKPTRNPTTAPSAWPRCTTSTTSPASCANWPRG